jgi:hypothetical protein
MTFPKIPIRHLAGALVAAVAAAMPAACADTYTPQYAAAYVPPPPQVYAPSYSPSYTPATPTYDQPAYQQTPTYDYSQVAPPQPTYGSNTSTYQVPDYSQPSTVNTAPSYTVENPAPQVQALTEQQVADMTASIALYPDPLLAAMLPAATYPDQLADAQRWLDGTPRPDELSIQNLPYEPPIKTLLHYPDVLRLMSSHLDWTQALGAAFVYQPQDVMNSIQRWRSIAQTQGYLQSTPQQQVIATGPTIEILPPSPEVVYVPVYDPGVIFSGRPIYGRPPIDYRECGPGGGWLDFGLDWRDREVLVPTRPYWDRRDRGNSWYDDYRNQRWTDRDRRDDRNGRVASAPPPAIERRAFARDSLRPSVAYPQRIVTPTDQRVITPQRLSDAQRRAQQQQAAAQQQQNTQQQGAQQAVARQRAANEQVIRQQQAQRAANEQTIRQQQAQRAANQQQAAQQQAVQREAVARQAAAQQAAAQQAAQQAAARDAAARQAQVDAARGRNAVNGGNAQDRLRALDRNGDGQADGR